MARQTNKALPVEFYQRDAVRVARDLLGKLLVRRNREGITSGIIVETEAYLHKNDSACHAAAGLNRKNKSMFGPPGTAYVYVIHARHCFNVVTHDPGVPEAVLIRAIEPVAGIGLMQRRRNREALLDLARGPARLCEAMQINRDLDAHDLCSESKLWIGEGDSESIPANRILATPRIGVTSQQEKKLRFVYADHSFVSRSR
jgi:DNA-3-methyladenine glycosylase